MADSKKCFDRMKRFTKLYEMLDVTTKYSHLCQVKAENFDKIVEVVQDDIDAEKKVFLISEIILSCEVSGG